MKKDVEKSLILAIADGLSNIQVEYNAYVGRMGDWINDANLDLPQDIRTKLEKCTNGSGLKTIIKHEINSRLRGAYKWDAERSQVPLTEYPEFSKPNDFAREIVDLIKSLPFNYTASVGLPLNFSAPILEHVNRYQLSDNIILWRGDSPPFTFRMKSDDERLQNMMFMNVFGEDKTFEEELNHERLYFTVKCSGYAGSVGEEILASDLEDHVRAFFGAARALNLLTLKSADDHYDPKILIHENNDGRRLVAACDPEPDISRTNIKLSTKSWAEKIAEGKEYYGIDSMCTIIAKIYGDKIDSKRLFNGCIWYFRSTLSQRPLDALLESTIAIEAMLGDKEAVDGVGIMKLLSNRCAYMLGRTAEERERIKDTFSNMYRVRSSIVHSGKHRPDHSDREIIKESIRLCGRIIAHELRGW